MQIIAISKFARIIIKMLVTVLWINLTIMTSLTSAQISDVDSSAFVELNATDTMIALLLREEVTVFDSFTGETILTIEQSDTLALSGLSWHTSNPHILAVSNRKGGTQIIDVTSGTVLYTFNENGTNSVDFSPDGQYIVTSHGSTTPPDSEGYIRVIEIDTGQENVIFEPASQRVSEVTWSPDQTKIVGAHTSEKGKIGLIWEVSTGVIIAQISELVQYTDEDGFSSVGGNIRDIKWNYDGTLLAIDLVSSIGFYETNTFTKLHESELILGIDGWNWNPNNNTIAIGDELDHMIKFLDFKSGRIIHSILINGQIQEVTYSTDGSQLVYIGNDDFTTLTDVTTPNLLPIADAGPDQTVQTGTFNVTLDGTGSYDPDGTIQDGPGVSDYVWTDDNANVIATGSRPRITLPAGVHQIILTVTDNDGASASDSVTITVQAPPDANAGADQTIAVQATSASVTLDASGSSDQDGTIASYVWEKWDYATNVYVSFATGVSPQMTLAFGTMKTAKFPFPIGY